MQVYFEMRHERREDKEGGVGGKGQEREFWNMAMISGEMDLPAWQKSSTSQKCADKSKRFLCAPRR